MEDKSKRSDDDVAAAPTKPAADLDARFLAMRLEDPPSLRRPQPQAQPEPLQVPVPTTRADAQQQFEAVRQHWPQPPSHDVGESSAAAEYASLLGHRSPGNFLSSHFGAYSPRFNALAAEPPSVSAIAPPYRSLVSSSPSMPSSSTNQHYQPTASASPARDHNFGLNPFASAMPAGRSHNPSLNPFAYAPPAAMPAGLSHNPSLIRPYAGYTQSRTGAASFVQHDNASIDPYASAPPAGFSQNPRLINPYAGYTQPHTGAASFVQHDNASIDPYASTFLNELHDNNLADYCQPWMDMPDVPSVPTLQEVRSHLLQSPMDPELVMSPQTATHVVRLLQEGRVEVRRSVLAGVMRAVHSVMESREGHRVFLTLLSACEVLGDEVELRCIVHAVCGGRDVLKGILKYDHGVKALKALIGAVAPYHQLSKLLILWLLKERLTEHGKCVELLNHCFARIPYDTCSIMIQFAIRNIDAMLSSASGSVYLAACFVKARNVELRILEEILLSHTSKIAMGEYSNYFMQRVLESGSEALKESIAERIVTDVVNLSLDKFGSYVVEACFLLTCSFMPMRSVLFAFLHLPSEQLAELVQGDYSNYVVHKLLASGKRPFPKATTALARRIEKLPAAVRRHMHAQRVVQVVQKLLPRKPHY